MNGGAEAAMEVSGKPVLWFQIVKQRLSNRDVTRLKWVRRVINCITTIAVITVAVSFLVVPLALGAGTTNTAVLRRLCC